MTPNLTPQQQRVLEATDGRTIEEIAQALGMTPRTVKYHSDLLRARFNVKNRRQLIPLRLAAKTEPDGTIHDKLGNFVGIATSQLPRSVWTVGLS